MLSNPRTCRISPSLQYHAGTQAWWSDLDWMTRANQSCSTTPLRNWTRSTHCHREGIKVLNCVCLEQMALWKCPNKHQKCCMVLVVFLLIYHKQSLSNFLAVVYQHSSFLTWKSSAAIPVLSLFWTEMETCQNVQEYCEYCEWGVLRSPVGLQTPFYTRSEQGCEPRCLKVDYCINLLCHLSAFITNSCCI